MNNKFKRIISLILCLLLAVNGSFFHVRGENIIGENNSNNENVVLEEINEFGDYVLSVSPSGTAEKIEKVITDSVIELEKATTKYVAFLPKPSYYVENNKLYLKKLKNKHTLTLKLNNGETYNFIYRDGKFEKINENDIPKKQLHVKLEGYFEGALVGQKKYDAISGATGSATSNNNSNIKVMVAETEPGLLPADSDWTELSKSEIEVDKGRTKINLDSASGMEPRYNAMTSAVTLNGIPGQASNYPITLDLYDIYGRHAKSNEAWFGISDPEKVYLEDVLKDVNLKLVSRPGNRVLWYQEPWYIIKFNKNKINNHESITVNKNINLWYGSRESGVYGVLGQIVPVTTKKDKKEGEVFPWEDRVPFQDLVLEEGTDLTIAHMKIMSGVNIIVKKGAVLNLHDSSIYGKVTVDGGTLRVNHNKNGDFDGKNVVSGTSIQGQIILNDGAVLEDSTIYSNTNNITDAGAALQNIKPVVLVKGDAFVKGNVFVRGDESPTGTDIETGKYYRGQNAMKIDGGSLTIANKSSLYLYGGGTKSTTSLGGNALELENNGKVLGDGTLVAMGGSGASDVAGYAVTGLGNISVNKTYLRAGNSYNKNIGKQKAVSENVKIHKNVVGNMIDTDPIAVSGDHDYDEYWKYSSSPKDISRKIGNEVINPSGEEKIPGKDIPEDLPEYGEGPKRVELISKDTNRYSIDINMRDKNSVEWINSIKNKKAILTLNNNKTLEPSNSEEKLGYHVNNGTLYIYSLNINDKIVIKLNGYKDIALKAIPVDQYVKYRLDIATNINNEKPIVPEDDIKIDNETIEKARKKAKEILSNMNLDFLKVQGINEDLNKSNIETFKNKVEELKKLVVKNDLTDTEKKELVEFTQKNKNGKYIGFRKLTKNILIDLRNNGKQTVKNKHDGNRLHVRLKDGKTTFESKLKNVRKIGNPKLKIYYILNKEYDTKVNTVSGATPEFEEHLLEAEYYDIKYKENGKYEISVNENKLLKDKVNISLLKCVFCVELAEGIYIENKDFVFLSENNSNENIPNLPIPNDNKDNKPGSNSESEENSNKKPSIDLTTYKGYNRYGTAVEISKNVYENADDVIIATGENPIDALSASVFAHSKKAPILLSRKNKIDREVLDEIKRLKTKRVTIVGGIDSVSETVVNQLKNEKVSVKRISGKDRYVTSMNILKEGGFSFEKVLIVSGSNYADALSLSGYSAMKNIPMVLVSKEMDNNTVELLKNTKEFIVIGGDASISDNILNKCRKIGRVERIYGVDRYETSYKALNNLYKNRESLVISSGDNNRLTDALAGSSVAAINKAPIVLVNKNIDESVLGNKKYENIFVLGGKDSVTEKTRNTLKKYLKQ